MRIRKLEGYPYKHRRQVATFAVIAAIGLSGAGLDIADSQPTHGRPAKNKIAKPAKTEAGIGNAPTSGEALAGTVTFFPNTHFRSSPSYSVDPAGYINDANVVKVVKSNEIVTITNPIVKYTPDGSTWYGAFYPKDPNMTMYVNASNVERQIGYLDNIDPSEEPVHFKYIHGEYNIAGQAGGELGQISEQYLPSAAEVTE